MRKPSSSLPFPPKMDKVHGQETVKKITKAQEEARSALPMVKHMQKPGMN